MRDRQGWPLGGDQDELLLRAAKFTNYTAVNRLIFYEALRKRFTALPELSIGTHIKDGESLFGTIRAFLDEARGVTGDYETVFGVDPSDIGDRIPFYDNSVVDSWRRLCAHVHIFDFTKLEYDVIGQIFETLISPEERHKYGQYYTRPEVVDVINSFCIRNGDCAVMDPACGGGTFLVRAYARKKYLSPKLNHSRLLQDIYGVDVSRFATHLSTINLAARDLIDAENYPRILASDFFHVRANKPFMSLPGASGKQVNIDVPRLDAVVANPPYVRQEDIPSQNKDAYRKLVKSEVQLDANGRSDLHVYFWGHAVSFMKPNAWLGFLTSSQWLDVEYGFTLQHFLLERFKVVAIIESRMEPWFVGKVYRDISADDRNVPREGVRIPGKGTPEVVNDLLMVGVRFRAGKGQGELVLTRSVEQARLVIKVFELGSAGRNQFLPIEKYVILNQIKRIDALMKARRTKVRELIEARTSDAEIGRKAFEMVMARF